MIDPVRVVASTLGRPVASSVGQRTFNRTSMMRCQVRVWLRPPPARAVRTNKAAARITAASAAAMTRLWNRATKACLAALAKRLIISDAIYAKFLLLLKQSEKIPHVERRDFNWRTQTLPAEPVGQQYEHRIDEVDMVSRAKVL